MALAFHVNDSASPLSSSERNQIADASARLEESFEGLAGCHAIVQRFVSSRAGLAGWGIHLTLTTDGGTLTVRCPPTTTFEAAVDDAFLAAWRELWQRGQHLVHHEAGTTG
jgi:hypothetical protein